MINWLFFAFLIAKKARELKVDIIYSNALVSPIGAIASLIAGKPHIWHIREAVQEGLGLYFDLGIEKAMKYVAKTSVLIVLVSNAVLRVYRTYLPKHKTYVVYDGIEIPKDADHKKREREGAIRLLMLGRIHPTKGHADAINAVFHLTKQNYRIRLIIVGCPSSYKEELERIVKEMELENHIYFKTPLLLDLIKPRPDAVLVCSRFEGFGLVTAEAMARKIPVIGAKAGATKELIKDGETGLLYTPGRSDELAERIKWLITNPKKVKKMVENAYLYAKTNFCFEKNSEKIYQLIKRAISICRHSRETVKA